MEMTHFILMLCETPGVGPKTIAAILHRNAALRRSPEEFLDLTPDQMHRQYDIRYEIAQDLGSNWTTRYPAATEMAQYLRRNGITLINYLEAMYPQKLIQHLVDPPPALFAYGNMAIFSLPLFALANSNGASEGALASSDAAAAVAMDCGWLPVTGHNRYAYQRTALVARRTGGRVLYVLDRGLFSAFGKNLDQDLFPAARIWSPSYDPSKDLTLTQFSLHSHEIGDNNRKRDNLIFALADVIMVGQTRPRGRMEAVCRAALARGQKVLLVGPESPEDSRLQDAGAERVCDDADLAEKLNTLNSAS